MKRLISLLLVAVMLLCLLPAGVAAASGDKLIALTFDDGPAVNTKRLIDGLRARGVHCTFFLVGTGVEARPELVKQMWLDGHEIACHTYNHPALTGQTDEQIRNQLNKTYGLLDKAIGLDLDYMVRPPYGDYNSRVLSTVNKPCFYWSMDTHDWQTSNADSVYNEFLKQVRDGSLVLLHDTHSSSVDAALRAIDTLKARGYEFVTVSEMFYRRGVTLQNGKMYYSAYPGDYGTADGIQAPVIRSEIKNGTMQVTITGDSRGKVYYTTSGEDPNPANSIRYTGPFSVTGNLTVKAESVLKWNGLRSSVTSQSIRYSPASTPQLTIENGLLSMKCSTDGAEIFYTSDGSVPTREATKYSGSIKTAPGTTYRAIAFAPAHDPSGVAMLTHTALGHVLTDVAVSAWYYKSVDAMMAKGLFKGVTETKFAPDVMLTRAMLVAVLYRLHGAPDASILTEPFDDVPDTMWCRDAIAWASDSGIVKGYADGSFQPKKELSRQELCAMLARYMRYMGKDADSIEHGTLANFSDSESVHRIFIEDVDTICSLGILTGFTDGTLRPKAGATRAQAATMLSRTIDILSLLPDAPQAPDPEQPGDPEQPSDPE